MSSNTVNENNGQQAIITTDTRKIFVWNNRFESAKYNNSTYDDVTLKAGQVMGRIAASAYIVPLTSGASDGSQFPVGILAEDVTVEGGDIQDVNICVAGDVAADLLFFSGTDNLNTVVSDRRLVDRIGSDTVGIKLVGGDSMTNYDNL